MAKSTASTGKHQAIQKRVKVLQERIGQVELEITKRRVKQHEHDHAREQELTWGKKRRALAAELAGLNRLGFEGV